MSNSTGEVFSNPVIPGFYPDPSVCRVGTDFYLVTSSFEYAPGIPIFHSTDLVSWVQIGHCLSRPSQLDLSRARASQGIYAPTIRWNDGTFFVTATNVAGGGHFIVNATDPAGPWSDPVWVDQDGIDPSLYFEDGVAYFQSNIEPNTAGEHTAEPGFERGIQQSIVNPVTGERLTEPRWLWGGSGGRFPEAPHLYKRDGLYYLVIAEGGTEAGHMVTVARADNPWGPFQSAPTNPILSHRSTSSPIQSTGHADLVELQDGSWWAVLLGTRPIRNVHHIGRETFLTPVVWDADGWPSLGEGGRVKGVHARPSTPASGWSRPVEAASQVPPGLEWNGVRRFPDEFAAFNTEQNSITITSTALSTGDPMVSFLGRRQQHHRFVAQVGAELLTEHGEVGLMVRSDDDHHYEVGLAADDAGEWLVFRRQIGDLVDERRVRAHTKHVKLRVVADDHQYSFSVLDVAGELQLGVGDARYLSSEVTGGFTGAYVGMYVTGNTARGRVEEFHYAEIPAPQGAVPVTSSV